MILSKASLNTVDLTRSDKAIPMLDNVHITKDGATVAANGMVHIIVSPVPSDIKEKVPLKEGEHEEVTINSRTIRDVLKNIPRDTKFGGLLEFTSVESSADGRVHFRVTDSMKKDKIITGRKYDRGYSAYKDILQRMYTSKRVYRMVLNLRRLTLLVDTLNKICQNTADISPVFVEFTEQDDLIVRTVNIVTGQRIVAVMSSLKGGEGEWMDEDEWEKQFYERPRRVATRRNRKAVRRS